MRARPTRLGRLQNSRMVCSPAHKAAGPASSVDHAALMALADASMVSRCQDPHVDNVGLVVPGRGQAVLNVHGLAGPIEHMEATGCSGLAGKEVCELATVVGQYILDLHGAHALPSTHEVDAAVLSSKYGFATLLDPRGGRPASAGLGALRVVSVAARTDPRRCADGGQRTRSMPSTSNAKRWAS